jgi:two-component system, NarL family, sensor kinase
LATREDRSVPAAAPTETERLVAWLRVPAIVLIGAGHGISSPQERGFNVALALFGIWAGCLLAWVYLRPVTARFALIATAADIVAITALVFLSGGAFSEARAAYFLVPVAVAFRFRPPLTALAGGAAIVAYLIQALADSNSNRPHATRLVVVHTGYLIWITAAAALLSYLLARRTRRIAELAAVSRRLAAEALLAEERERQSLAEGLHDNAIQTLLSAKHDLEEAETSTSHPALTRADAALTQTVSELREALFELHPYVLSEAGLETALRTIGQRAARRGGFQLRLDLHYPRRHPQEQLLLAAARELLINAGRHASARNVTVRLAEAGNELSLAVTDDGRGFDPSELNDRLAEGHIGLAAQRLRVESAGGNLDVRSSPGWGTTVEVRLPMDGAAPG